MASSGADHVDIVLLRQCINDGLRNALGDGELLTLHREAAKRVVLSHEFWWPEKSCFSTQNVFFVAPRTKMIVDSKPSLERSR